jgi:hypothetical protein
MKKQREVLRVLGVTEGQDTELVGGDCGGGGRDEKAAIGRQVTRGKTAEEMQGELPGAASSYSVEKRTEGVGERDLGGGR